MKSPLSISRSIPCSTPRGPAGRLVRLYEIVDLDQRLWHQATPIVISSKAEAGGAPCTWLENMRGGVTGVLQGALPSPTMRMVLPSANAAKHSAVANGPFPLAFGDITTRIAARYRGFLIIRSPLGGVRIMPVTVLDVAYRPHRQSGLFHVGIRA